MTRRLACSLVLGAAVFGVSPPVRADGCEAETAAVRAMSQPDPALTPPTNPDAKARMSAGNGHYRVQDYALAVAEYKAGALLSGDPVFLYNIAQSFRLGHEYPKAIRQYQLFLDRGAPGREVRALIECHVRGMQRELDQAASKEQPTGPAPESAGPLQPAEPALASRSVDAEPWYADRFGLALAGGGIAVGAVGVVLLLDGASLADESEREDREDIRNELRERADSRRLWGTVVTAIGGAALVLGVVKLAITPDQPDPASLSLVLGPGEFALAGTW